jgi:hypothetical protein
MSERVRLFFSPVIRLKKLHGRWWVDLVSDRKLAQQFVADGLGLARSRGRTSYADDELGLISRAASQLGYCIETVDPSEREVT